MRNPDPENAVPRSDVTAILHEWSAGDAGAAARLMPIVYEQLRQLARVQLQAERSGHTLQPTALVHEAYLRLVDQRNANWQSRAHFFAIASRLMRRILLDHARAHLASKRGGLDQKLSLDDLEIAPEENSEGLLALDAALEKLARNYPRQGNVVELKFFGGLAASEIAESLQVSEKTVLRDWSFAKLWLCRELDAEMGHHADA